MIYPFVVDAIGNRLNAAWRINFCVLTTAIKKAVFDAVTVLVKANDLSLIVDAIGYGIRAALWINHRVKTGFDRSGYRPVEFCVHLIKLGL
jgi:hypothetical protein